MRDTVATVGQTVSYFSTGSFAFPDGIDATVDKVHGPGVVTLTYVRPTDGNHCTSRFVKWAIDDTDRALKDQRTEWWEPKT